jgi:cytochrome P450
MSATQRSTSRTGGNHFLRAFGARRRSTTVPRAGPYWSVTRYNDIMTVELDHSSYSSELGGIQVEDQPADMKRASFIRMDPPCHTAQRRTVAPVAARNNLASYETTIRQRTRAVLDALPRKETFDWVDKVAIELTTMMLATLFDFPWEQRRKLTYWSDVAICNVNAPDAPVHTEEERFAELLRMADVFKGLWNQRVKGAPRLDLISMMARSSGTRAMPEMEFVGNLALLIVGGNDTTRNSMSGGLLALSENLGELDKLKANPALVPSLVAETIRYQTPVIHMRRSNTRHRACRPAHPPERQGRHVVHFRQPRRERDQEPRRIHRRPHQTSPASLLWRWDPPLRRRSACRPAAAHPVGRDPCPRS